LTPPTISSQTCDQKIRISSKYMMQGWQKINFREYLSFTSLMANLVSAVDPDSFCPDPETSPINFVQTFSNKKFLTCISKFSWYFLAQKRLKICQF
jgi:hypothetical protein